MKNEFDNKVTDKGWRSMHRLLDREMPERRRRFAWWPFALFLLSLAGAGGWLLLEGSKPVDVTPPSMEAPKVVEPVAYSSDDSKSSDELITKAEAHAAHSSDDSKSSDELKAGAHAAVAAYSSDDSKSSDELKAAAHSSDDSKSSDELTQEVVASSLSLVFPTEADVMTVERPSSDLPQNTVTIKKFDPLAPLSERPPKRIEVTSPQGCFAGGAVKKKKGNARWSFGVSAGLASENFSALNGFSAGAAGNWHFARQWGLRSGLQYAQYRLAADERPVVSLAGNVYAEATGNDVLQNTGTNPSSNTSYPTVLVPVERLQQLEMPVLAYWQPFRPLRIFGGITPAYTLSAQASEQNYANNQSYYTFDVSAKKNLNDLTSKTLSRWQMNWQVGMGVRMGRHFELDAFYKHGFGGSGKSDYDNMDSSGNFNAGVPANSAGASHYFLLNGIWFF